MLDRIEEIVQDGRDAGHHLGAQVVVVEHGEPVLDEAFGESRPGEPLTRDHLMLWLSCSKPLTAIVVAQEVEAGRVDLEAPIAQYVPEFAEGGKEAITVWQALTHTGGFRNADIGWKPRPWDETVARICATRKEARWEPGEKAGYHVDASWYLLGEVVARTTGLPFDRVLRERVLDPLGMMNSWVGMSDEAIARMQGRIGGVFDTSKAAPEEMTLYGKDRILGLCRPGGNGRGPAHELARFYQALLDGGEGVVHPATIATFVGRQREGMFDHSFQHDLDWGLGFIVDNKRYGADTAPYGFGRYASDASFGHGGNRSSMAMADPDNGLVIVVLFNGLASEAVHQSRMRTILETIYDDLGLG